MLPVRVIASSTWSIKPFKVFGVSSEARSKPCKRSIKNLNRPSLLFLAALISASVKPSAVASVLLAGCMPPCTRSRSSCTSCLPSNPMDFTALTPTVVSCCIWSMLMPAPRPGPSRARKVVTNSSLVAAVRKASVFMRSIRFADMASASFHCNASPLSCVMDDSIPAMPMRFVSMFMEKSQAFCAAVPKASVMLLMPTIPAAMPAPAVNALLKLVLMRSAALSSLFISP